MKVSIPDLIIRPTRPTLTAELVGRCGYCNGEEFVSRPQPGYENTVCECRCRRQAKAARRFDAALIPWRFAKADMDSLDRDDRQYLDAVSSLGDAVLADDVAPTLLLLVGDVGSGKTWMLCALIRLATLEEGKSARYVNARDLQQFRSKTGFSDFFEQMRSIDVLALDELGYQRTEFERHAVSDILSWRYDHGALTLAASNLSRAGLAEQFGESIADRLFENYHVIPGGSQR